MCLTSVTDEGLNGKENVLKSIQMQFDAERSQSKHVNDSDQKCLYVPILV